MPNCRHLLMSINNGGKMKKRAITSMRVHGQMLAGRLKALISTGNKQDWFEHDGEGQCAVGIVTSSVLRTSSPKGEDSALGVFCAKGYGLI